MTTLSQINDYNPLLRLLSLPMGAIGWAGPVRMVRSCGLPAGTIKFDKARLIIGVTPCDVPVFDDLREAATQHKADVMLIRAGLFPETENPVRIDLALYGEPDVLLLTDYHFCRLSDRSLWLCPEKLEGPIVAIENRGLELYLSPPFTDLVRSDAACKAAAEIVRTMRGVR